MKRALQICVFLLPIICFSQINGDFTIDWQGKKEMSYGEQKLIIPYFAGNSFRFDTAKKSITLMLNLNQSTLSNSNSIQISNVVYESISTSDLGDLTLINIPERLNESIKTVSSRGIQQIFLILSPIIKEGNSYKKIKSFSYSSTSSNSRTNNSAITQKSTVVSNSVLASGDWYRFYVEKSGVYKISKSFLQSLGFEASKVDPRRIKIYGNGGRMLPLANSSYYPEDLVENAIQISGESDGVFNNEDFILFYAEGVDNWNTESQTNINVYSTKSYYYITSNGNDGKRIANLAQPTGITTLELNTFDDYQ